MAWVAACTSLLVVPTGCGSSSSNSGTSAVPLTLSQVKSNLSSRGYKVTSWSSDEGALQIDSTHTAQAGFSVDHAPDGQQLYAAVYQTGDPAVRQAIIKHNSDETAPVLRGDLIFTISGTGPELQKIVKDAGDLPPAGAQRSSSSDAAAASAAMERFIKLDAAGDSKALCATFTPQALSKSKTFCDPTSVFYHRSSNPRISQYQISSVTTSGDTATATVTDQGTTEQVALRRVGGSWKIDTQLGAGALF